jgi:hypothetical protein
MNAFGAVEKARGKWPLCQAVANDLCYRPVLDDLYCAVADMCARDRLLIGLMSDTHGINKPVAGRETGVLCGEEELDGKAKA